MTFCSAVVTNRRRWGFWQKGKHLNEKQFGTEKSCPKRQRQTSAAAQKPKPDPDAESAPEPDRERILV